MAIYNLEERTLQFSQNLITFCYKLPKTNINSPLINQIVRSGTSVGANYREANDGLGKKDSVHSLKIARKEAKETSYWLELLLNSNPNFELDLNPLIKECVELRNILSSMINKSG